MRVYAIKHVSEDKWVAMGAGYSRRTTTDPSRIYFSNKRGASQVYSYMKHRLGDNYRIVAYTFIYEGPEE
jgi:hypothetical protein